jgi:putative transposase
VSAFRLIEAERANYPVAVLCAGCSKSPRAATLRLEIQAALQEEPRECRPHGEDPRGSPQEPRDLRLPAGARRAARPGCTVRSAQGGPANAGCGASGLHARQEAWNHPPRHKDCSRTGSVTQGGFLYLAFILEAHSRKVVGWSMASHMKTELVVDALQMAVWRRKPSAGLVHHSYNRRRLHSALSYRSPAEYEEATMEGVAVA